MALTLALELCVRAARGLLVEDAGARWDARLDERLLRGVLATPLSRSLPVGELLARYRDLAATRDVLGAQYLLPLADLPTLIGAVRTLSGKRHGGAGGAIVNLGSVAARIGSPAMTTRGFTEIEAETIAHLVADVLEAPNDEAVAAAVRTKVAALCAKFPVYGA